ncbi:unnamed protein product [Protopolystoma xenopodis]|uniref:Uncharacterized protein n=1 Tax=Protopolystoma xenopodis TaxID=117903 RepID=A0A448WRU0_9PLAT|nr:unnamed protein product [Protopolystoma xenopodis]
MEGAAAAAVAAAAVATGSSSPNSTSATVSSPKFATFSTSCHSSGNPNASSIVAQSSSQSFYEQLSSNERSEKTTASPSPPPEQMSLSSQTSVSSASLHRESVFGSENSTASHSLSSPPHASADSGTVSGLDSPACSRPPIKRRRLVVDETAFMTKEFEIKSSRESDPGPGNSIGKVSGAHAEGELRGPQGSSSSPELERKQTTTLLPVAHITTIASTLAKSSVSNVITPSGGRVNHRNSGSKNTDVSSPNMANSKQSGIACSVLASPSSLSSSGISFLATISTPTATTTAATNNMTTSTNPYSSGLSVGRGADEDWEPCGVAELRCRICGYVGQTARGMRLHSRLHDCISLAGSGLPASRTGGAFRVARLAYLSFAHNLRLLHALSMSGRAESLRSSG